MVKFFVKPAVSFAGNNNYKASVQVSHKVDDIKLKARHPPLFFSLVFLFPSLPALLPVGCRKGIPDPCPQCAPQVTVTDQTFGGPSGVSTKGLKFGVEKKGEFEYVRRGTGRGLFRGDPRGCRARPPGADRPSHPSAPPPPLQARLRCAQQRAVGDPLVSSPNPLFFLFGFSRPSSECALRGARGGGVAMRFNAGARALSGVAVMAPEGGPAAMRPASSLRNGLLSSSLALPPKSPLFSTNANLGNSTYHIKYSHSVKGGNKVEVSNDIDKHNSVRVAYDLKNFSKVRVDGKTSKALARRGKDLLPPPPCPLG